MYLTGENHFIWSENYILGIETIDNQHKKLFEIVQELIDLFQKLKK